MADDTQTAKPIGLEGLLADYAPLGDAADEIIGRDGAIRPVWREFLSSLSNLSRDELEIRLARGDQYIRDSGVFFRQADTGAQTTRQWPLSPMPVLIDEAEWDHLIDGLVQRADLLEQVMADLYGDAALVRDHHIPSRMIARSPEWVRPMVGVTPPSGHYLHFLAFEVGRAPNGEWWVLNDRSQAPSGAGFALENRVATSRIFSDIFNDLNVHRLAGFFQDFEESLMGLRIGDDSQAALLTPGTLSATYYEHAYIARYLGLLLVEGEDILVERGRPMVRTVSGLKPISVLWRRLDTMYSDPLELSEDSQIGVPGLIGAIRQNAVSVVNAIGSGVLETRAMLAFYPRLAKIVLGEDLKIPNVATWWCGQDAERETVMANLDKMSIAPALSTRLPFDPEDHVQFGREVIARNPADMAALLDRAPETVVGQELVTLSTTGAISDGKLEARPFSLRVFLGRTAQGWTALPGGYARIGKPDDVTAVGMNRGGSVSDVWVVSPEPVEIKTMIGDGATPRKRPDPNNLPSRAADNLFWLGRYLERAENTIRFARAYQLRRTETGEVDTPLMDYMHAYMEWLGYQNGDIRSGITSTVAAAAHCARRLRDRLSPDGLVAVGQLEEMTQFGDPAGSDPPSAARKSRLLRQLASFTGLVHENMYRSLAWRYLTSGRALERATSYMALLSHFTTRTAPAGALEIALECCDSVHSHRLLHGFNLTRSTVKHLLAFEQNNPRSIAAAMHELGVHLEAMPKRPKQKDRRSPLEVLQGSFDAFSAESPESLTAEDLLQLRQELWALSDAVSSMYMS